MNADSGQTTKREPYSSSAFREKDQITVTFGGETSGYGWLFERGDGLHAAVLANDAYGRGLADGEARVKEEVKKAVEEFRERAAKIAHGYCECVNGFDEGCPAVLAVYALPTEPEGARND